MQLLEPGALDRLDPSGYDVVVVGAGCAGLATALMSAQRGARVLVLEHTDLVGGTTAWSAGTCWIPGSHLGASVNPQDSIEAAGRYLDAAVGDRSDPALRHAFLSAGASVVAELESSSLVRFRAYPRHPDYLSELPGSTLCGRALEPLPFDGRLLGRLFRALRPPIPEFTVLGGMMVDRTDIGHLLAARKSLSSMRHAFRIVGRHLLDRTRYPRGTRLVMGNALVGRLLASLARHAGVTLALNATVMSICRGVGPSPMASQITVSHGGQTAQLTVRRGLVLAGGGFNQHVGLRTTLLPGVEPAWFAGPPGHTAALHDLIGGLGARLGTGSVSPAFWAPVSVRRRPDGSQAVFPHFVMDRAKPGVVAVNQLGERFVNESTSYHLFGLAMQRATPSGVGVPAFLVCDARALRQYGLGMVRPGGRGLEPFIEDGYLVQASTLQELAHRLGVPADRFCAAMVRFNQHAGQGHDPDYGRGTTAYAQHLGDPTWPGPNPNLGPVTEPPYYAVRLYPGDIGSATGWMVDGNARLLDTSGEPLPGLYAVGNDQDSIMGGVYPAPGITLGPALVFAGLAARHLMGSSAP